MFVLLYFLKICSVFVSVLKGFNQKKKKNKHTYTMYRETLAQIKNLSYSITIRFVPMKLSSVVIFIPYYIKLPMFVVVIYVSLSPP